MISCAKRTFSRSQALSASSGMNSMNRISTPVSRAKFPNGTISSSVNPRTETALILTGSKPDLLSGFDAFDDLFVSVAAGDFLKFGGVQGIQTDIDPPQVPRSINFRLARRAECRWW